MEEKQMLKKLQNNFINSLNGIKVALKEHSFVLEILLGLPLALYIFFSNIGLIFKLLLILNFFLILIFEIFNTSIEKLCNKITKENDDEIKGIKDLSSSGVFLSIICLFILFFISL